jgi:hypothetical protein
MKATNPSLSLLKVKWPSQSSYSSFRISDRLNSIESVISKLDAFLKGKFEQILMTVPQQIALNVQPISQTQNELLHRDDTLANKLKGVCDILSNLLLI